MAIPWYLAMSESEVANAETLPRRLAWLGCRFSPGDQVITGLPEMLPPDSLLVITDHAPPEEHDMTKLVLETIFSFYEIFKQKGYEPVLDIDEKSHKIMCSDVAVKRVISNIIKNALVHGIGDIKISYGVVDNQLLFTCENSLAHHDNMDVSQVFERFYKADKSRNEKSTGLGLAIAKEMVEKMDGHIEARLEDRRFIIEVGFFA